jgi:hypothetical protein
MGRLIRISLSGYQLELGTYRLFYDEGIQRLRILCTHSIVEYEPNRVSRPPNDILLRTKDLDLEALAAKGAGSHAVAATSIGSKKTSGYSYLSKCTVSQNVTPESVIWKPVFHYHCKRQTLRSITRRLSRLCRE